MSYVFVDRDEFETISRSGPGWMSQEQRRREPEEVARIKAEKLRVHEDAVLAEAHAIQLRRQGAKP